MLILFTINVDLVKFIFLKLKSIIYYSIPYFRV